MVDYYYDRDQDILSIDLGRNSHSSVPVGGLVIDFTDDGELAGLEVFNASENISMYTDVSLEEARSVLENIEDLSLESKMHQGMMSIVVDFKSRKDKELLETRMPLNVQAA